MTNNGKLCRDCKVFAKHYGGEGDGPACMHPNALKFHEQNTGRPCPFVPLDHRNREASDILWLGLFERLHFITPDYIHASLADKRPAEKLKIFNRVVAGLQCDHVIRWMNRSYASAQSRAKTKSASQLSSKPQKRAPRPNVKNRWGKSS